jgi:four helix bundle protein
VRDRQERRGKEKGEGGKEKREGRLGVKRVPDTGKTGTLSHPRLLDSGGMRDHRGLRCWQEARHVSLQVLRLSRQHWCPQASAAFMQLQRASLSVQLNIAEGYTFGDSPSFTRHLAIAFGSAVETIELIELLADAEVIERQLASDLLRHSLSSRNMLIGLLKQRRKYR